MIEEVVAYRTKDGSVYRDRQRAIEAEAALANYEAGQRALREYLQPHGIDAEGGTRMQPSMIGPWDLRIESVRSYGGNPSQDATVRLRWRLPKGASVERAYTDFVSADAGAVDIVLTLRDALALFIAAPEPVGAATPAQPAGG